MEIKINGDNTWIKRDYGHILPVISYKQWCLQWTITTSFCFTSNWIRSVTFPILPSNGWNLNGSLSELAISASFRPIDSSNFEEDLNLVIHMERIFLDWEARMWNKYGHWRPYMISRPMTWIQSSPSSNYNLFAQDQILIQKF